MARNVTKQSISVPWTTASVPSGARHNNRGLLLAATALTLALWYVPGATILLYPIRLFVTFVHESGHALAAVATGGWVQSLTVRSDGSGVTMTQTAPWALGIVYSAGYLGSAAFGALLLQVGRFSRSPAAGRAALYAAAAGILAFTLLWAHNPFTNGFTLVVGLLLAAALFLLARFTSPRGAEFIAAFLAVQCILNAFVDLRNLLFLTSHHLGDNDAVFMSQQYPLPPVFWALLWAALALAILGISLRSYWRGTSASPAQRASRARAVI